jgi:hypothetical protein
MRVIIRWTGLAPAGTPADQQLARFKRVVRAAQQTRRYEPLLLEAGLATPEAIAAIDSVDRILKRLPPIDLDDFRHSPADFESVAGPAPLPQPFQSPLEHTPKTAVLTPGFERTRNVRMFRKNPCAQLKRFAAEGLAAPVGLLRGLAADIESGAQELKPLKHFVVAFTGGDVGDLDDQDRELFWRVFQVPLFEQRLGFDGRLIAYECEAHNGLHIVAEHARLEQLPVFEVLLTSLTDLRHPTLRVKTRLSATIQHECCDCGKDTARLTARASLAGVVRNSGNC